MNRSLIRRIGLRVLAVAGFAGAAWFVGTSAAHAAEQTEPASAASPVGEVAALTPEDGVSLVDGLNGLNGLDGLVGTTATVLDSVITPVTEVLDPAEAKPRTSTSLAVSDVDTHGVRVTTAMSSLVSPFGLASLVDGSEVLLTPVTRVATPILTPMLRPVLRPVFTVAGTLASGDLRAGLTAVGTAVSAAVNTAVGTAISAGAAAERPGITPNLTATGAGSCAPAPGDESNEGSPVVSVPSTVDGLATAAGARGHGDHDGVVRAINAAMTPLHEFPGTQDVPGVPRPVAPLSGLPGLGTGGIPLQGSGPTHDGGVHALVPFTVASGAVAIHPLWSAAPVGMARQLAENPTVSPD